MTDPYHPPQAVVADQELPLALTPASLWLRLANMLIDYVMFYLLLVALIVGLSFVLSDGAIQTLFEGLWGSVLGIGVMFAYYVVMEGYCGRTVGKFVTGTRVVDEKGGPVRLGQVIGRSFARFIPFEVFSYFGEEKRGWHDSLPRTRVVKCR